MAKPVANFEEFKVAPDDPLTAEHAAVTAWVDDAVGSLGDRAYYVDAELKTQPSGNALLDGKPEQSRRYVMAAAAQARHWDQQVAQIRAQAETNSELGNPYRSPNCALVWGRRRQAVVVVSALLRRTLPLQREDLIALLQWCNESPVLSAFFGPVGSIARALERFAGATPVDAELCDAMTQFATRLRSSQDSEAKHLATSVEQLCVRNFAGPAGAPASPTQPVPTPAPAGTAGVLEPLKRLYGMPSDAAETPTEPIGPDRFPLGANSPLRQEHEWLSELLEEVANSDEYHNPTLTGLRAGRTLLAQDLATAGRVILAAAERHAHTLMAPSNDYTDMHFWRSRYATASITASLLQAAFEVDRDGLFGLVLYLSALPPRTHATTSPPIKRAIAQAESEAAHAPLTEGERFTLGLLRAALMSGPALGKPPEVVARLSRLINDGADFYLAPGEAWSDAANADLTRPGTVAGAKWAALLRHALGATSARPSAKWLKTAGALVNGVGGDEVRQALLRWLPLVTQGQSIRRLGNYTGDTRGASDVMNEENATALRGLLWLVQTLPQPETLARAVTAVALSAYKKVPGVGPRAVKVGNAAVYALSEIKSTEAVGQLAMLKVRVKFGTAQKEIEKAFNTAAEALGLPRDQIEEMGVPSYGMEEVGRREETFGDYRAELIVTGSDAELKWFDAKGKALKSVPAKVKSDHKDDLKELQQSLKDIQSMLPAQRDRIDSMFLLQKSWPFEAWRERYLNHPLIGTIARRLIWCVDGTPALFLDGQPTDVQGAPITPGPSAQVTLWHPVGASIDEITAWRRRVEEAGVTQPFKQAHREVYLLTDAERNTGTYSNRFAAHILRQHQFSALCAARGWKNRLRLMVDDSFPPAMKELPQWGLRAEFWVEGIGNDYGTDTNETGVFLRLSTDQVRFYRTAAAHNWAHAGGGQYDSAAAGPGPGGINEPLPLEEIPPLVFSEVMRDVDLFVGVSSVGNDPTWQDGGPEGRYRDYWQSYSFGELSGTATTRKQVLERLVPRLKIADRCSFSDRFLVVRGQKRTYKIHLGSGNILMEPNDEYLCIVPDSRARASEDDLFLPFEGDGTLSIILSKALLLAEDTKIKDPTITRQIDRR